MSISPRRSRELLRLPAPSPPAEPRLPRISGGRVLVFAGLVFLVDSWLAGLVGVGTGVLAASNGLLAAAALAAPLLGKSGGDEVRQSLARALSPLLRTPVLVGLGATFLVAGSCLGSLTVVADGDHGAVVLRPAAGGGAREARTAAGAEEARFRCPTTLFGRAYTLEVDGYLPDHVVVYPWHRRTVRAARDLRVAPSLLLRIPWYLHAVLDGGRLEVAVEDGGTITVPTSGDVAALLLGRRRSVAGLLPEWRLELAAGEAPDPGQSRSLHLWSAPTLRDDVTLRPDRAVVARFRREGGTVAAHAEVEVTAEPLQDVVLVPAVDGVVLDHRGDPR